MKRIVLFLIVFCSLMVMGTNLSVPPLEKCFAEIKKAKVS